MRTLALIILLAVAGALAAGPAMSPQDEGEETTADETVEPERVVLQVTRRTDVRGVVEFEDDHVIVVRDRDGEVHSYPKTRLHRIVRLLNPEPGQTGEVRLVSGERHTGVVLEDHWDHVLLQIEGIRTRFERELVHDLQLEPTFEQRYEEWKTSIDERTPERHYLFCRWLVNERRYELALTELKDLLRTHDHREARRLLGLVEAQLTVLRLAPSEATGTEPGETGGEGNNVGLVDLRDLLPRELVSRDDVNIVRVFEIDLRRPPEIAIGPQTIRALIEGYGTHPAMPRSQTARNALFNVDPVRIVELMFQVRARELYDQIEVVTEPYALNVFRENVHNTWLMNQCASQQCHGGIGAGRFFLHRDNHRNERVRTTNLLILERLELDDSWPLLNYEDPMSSLIIQHGLPRDRARRPHPVVDGWRPVFSPQTHRLLDDTLTWMAAMMLPRPDYPVEYEPPILGSALSEGAEGDEAEDGRVDR